MTRKPTAEATEPLWTIRELAAYLNMAPEKSFYLWVRRNGVPRRTLGGKVRFVPGEVRQWVESRKAS